ncbi:hypothetical protein [Methanococcus maripaludis]|uniref:Uncharacterized protein n=2 Tax=Methanococcus maripaludis TaxID=39152 RepID=A0A7J9PGG1_METMI|nr:hypothetical protein [Methanococcus maripaludis]MBA2861884.1 hypothetical protein [Methanococcus maripaludis]
MLGGLFPKVHDSVKVWKPKFYPNEKGYQDDLFHHLRTNLNNNSFFGSSNYSVRMESGRNLCDIAVERAVGIELKHNLDKKAKVDRLLGQVSRYMQDYSEGVLIVLTGETSTKTLEDLKYELRSINTGDSMGFSQKNIKIIEKKTPKLRTTSNKPKAKEPGSKKPTGKTSKPKSAKKPATSKKPAEPKKTSKKSNDPFKIELPKLELPKFF